MNFDFPTLLVLGTAITGLVWALDAMLWAPRRRARVTELVAAGVSQEQSEYREAAKEPVIVEYSRSFFPIILAVLLLRAFLVEPFRIPSGSMMPTLLIGDFILVNKFAYGLRLPVVHNRILDVGEPQRGDVMVFRFPKDPSTDYIKRVVGVPGDHLAYHNRVLFVNGKPLKQVDIGPYTGTDGEAMMTGLRQRVEELDSIEHKILVRPGAPSWEGEFVVPEGQYFVMGDNRDNSNDSRYWGTVPEENLVGKAFMIWMNWDTENTGIGWERIGRKIE